MDSFAPPFFDPAVATDSRAHPRTARAPLRRIAVRSAGCIAIVPVADLLRIDAEGNYVRLWTAERSWLHKDTLSALTACLDPLEFLRVHRSHTVRLRAVRELVPRLHGEFRLRLAGGGEITSGRIYRDAIRGAFGLA